jgi:phosphatidylserine decarboxylase precursor-related protein
MKYENLLMKLGYEYVILIILVALITKNVYLTLILILMLSIFFSSVKYDENDQIIFAQKKDIFYAPTQGRVLEIEEIDSKIIISIFLDITDNHKQYVPIKSKFIERNRIKGRNYPAYKTLSKKNNTVENILQSVDYKFEYKVIQRTGILTRRIESLIDINKTVDLLPGVDLGFIILGSRVEIEIPRTFVKSILIKENEYIKPMTPIFQLKEM